MPDASRVPGHCRDASRGSGGVHVLGVGRLWADCVSV